MTPKQQLVSHLAIRHGEDTSKAMRKPHQTLVLRHKDDHEARRLTHGHQPTGMTQGTDQIEYRIYLSPPKNPSASRNQDRNWVLTIAGKGGGWRWEMAGTWNGDVQGAKDAADKLLGYQAHWVKSGWGFEHKEKDQ
jgi:hypothetical protein